MNGADARKREEQDMRESCLHIVDRGVRRCRRRTVSVAQERVQVKDWESLQKEMTRGTPSNSSAAHFR